MYVCTNFFCIFRPSIHAFMPTYICMHINFFLLSRFHFHYGLLQINYAHCTFAIGCVELFLFFCLLCCCSTPFFQLSSTCPQADQTFINWLTTLTHLPTCPLEFVVVGLNGRKSWTCDWCCIQHLTSNYLFGPLP